MRIELRTALERLFGSEAADVYPYLATLLDVSLEGDPAARLANLSPESLQHQTFKVVQRWVEALSVQQPLGLVFDDLHWSDGASLALLEELLGTTEHVPLLLCLLFRPEREHGCWRLNDLARQRVPHRHVETVLRPLGPTETDQLVTNLLALPDFSVEIRELILQKAEGNPFFVEEVIRELIEAGILVRHDDGWRAVRPITVLEIPDNVQGVLLARIDRLPDQAKRVLQAASVIGRLFLLDTLRAMLREDGKVDTAVVDLQRHDLVVERRRIPRPEYRFRHALTQEVAYSTLTEMERRRLHGELARAFETQYGDRLEEVYGLLAYHYDHAGDDARAVHFLVKAGDKARTEYADTEALRHYERAVTLMKGRNEWEAAAHTLMKAALAHHIAFDFRAANRAYQDAFALLTHVPPPTPSLTPSSSLRWSTLGAAGLDLARYSDAPSAVLARQVFDGLLRWTPDDNVVPSLARGWEISEDGTQYRFDLHRDRQWSDGRPVTAHDFAFTWLRAMRGVNGQMFEDIMGANKYRTGETNDPTAVGIKALDDYTLEITLEGPRSYFPFILAHAATLPHPAWAVKAHPEDWDRPPNFVGNGPFIAAEWDPGESSRFVWNPNYRGRRKGNVKEVIVLRRFDDLQLFATGEVDVIYFAQISPGDADRLRGQLYADPPNRLLSIFFRMDRTPFDDRRVRLAFAHATDRKALSAIGPQYILSGDGGAVPPALPGHSPGIGIPFNPQAARSFLADAGYPDGRGLGPLDVPTPEGLDLHLVEAAARMWREILGVEVKVSRLSGADFWSLLATDPPSLGRVAWIADYPDPSDFLNVVYHSSSPSNYGRFKNAQFDSLVEEARRLTDQRQRMRLYHEADRILVAEEVAIIPLGYARTMMLVQPWVKGWTHWSVPIADLIVERPVDGSSGQHEPH